MTQDELIDQILLDVPDVPRASVLDQIKRMARELCQDTDVYAHTGLIVVGARTGYPQVIPPTGEPLRILWLKDGTRTLKAEQDFFQSSPTSIEFSYRPKQDVLTGRMACKPELSEDVPEELLNRWSEVIGNGARWRLLMLPQAWQDKELAMHYRNLFITGSNDAQRLVHFGHARGGARVKPRRYI